ncbi:Hypothetical protein EAG7_04079 [Klebsiella aerogenes]|nr:Hypothetical protein EAG7_04079 [Klebsiella aerogenes]
MTFPARDRLKFCQVANLRFIGDNGKHCFIQVVKKQQKQ